MAGLLERLQTEPDEASWKRLDDVYRPFIRAWLRRLAPRLGSDVDDVVQEVMVAVCRQLPHFRWGDRQSFRGWLRDVTRKMLNDYYRSRYRRGRAAEAQPGRAWLDQVADPHSELDRSELDRYWDEEYDRHVLRRLLHLIKPRVKPVTWDAFCRVVFDEAAPSEVAEELGLSRDAVYTARARVLKLLRQEAAGLLESMPAEHAARHGRTAPAQAEAAAPQPPRPPGPPPELARHSRYEIVQEIGRGGMGVVYRARDKVSGRTVALKVIRPERLSDPDAENRFLREARAASRLSHPNIGAVLGVGQAGPVSFLVLELVEGTSLDRVVAERGPLAVGEACEYVRQAALGLQHAYEQGIVHRDIKPHNLMLTAAPSPKVVVLDFGLALVPDAPPRAGGLTREGAFLGTPQYIAPEQASGTGQADIRADIYGLGCTLYHLLTGQPPFPADTTVQVLMKHVLEEPRALHEVRKDVPSALSAVVARMLAKDPADRFPQPAAVAQALAPFCRPGAEGNILQTTAPTPALGEEAVAGVATAQLDGPPDQVPLRVGAEYKLRTGARGSPGEGAGPRTAAFDVAVRAPDMDILPGWRQQVAAGPQPGRLAEFILVPRRPGRKRIEVDYYYQKHWLAHLDLEVEVVAV
jgi:RNA polymerase sigma factor (sigma-70 family)